MQELRWGLASVLLWDTCLSSPSSGPGDVWSSGTVPPSVVHEAVRNEERKRLPKTQVFEFVRHLSIKKIQSLICVRECVLARVCLSVRLCVLRMLRHVLSFAALCCEWSSLCCTIDP